MLKTLRIARLGTLTMALLAVNGALAGESTSAPASLPANGYLYRDCANDYFDPVLASCDELRVSSRLADVYIGCFFEEGLPAHEDEHFWLLRSKHVPLAVPRANYEDAESWVYGERKYFKYRKNVSTLDPTKTADAIVVIGDLWTLGGPEKVVSVDDPGVADRIVMTFWYTPVRGVEAVGFTNKSGGNEVYHCVERPCLFAPKQSLLAPQVE